MKSSRILFLMAVLKIFYSWQSDLHNSVNRGFILEILERVAKELRKDESLSIEPVIDRDTLGVSGTPDITTEILRKIDEATIVVCDVSIINGRSTLRQTPNPNVMFEMGYALKSKGWSGILMVVNEAYGKLDKLPFDLPKRRAITYSLKKDDDKTDPRQILYGKLKAQIKEILHQIGQNSAESGSIELISPKSKAELLAEEHAFQAKRHKWRTSKEGTDEARESAFLIYNEIQRLFDTDREHNDLIKNECHRGQGQSSTNLSLIHRGTMAFNLAWAQYYANDLDTAGILLEVNNLGVRKDRERKKRYRADINRQTGLVWFEESQKDRIFTPSELAAYIYDAFLDEIKLMSTPS